MYLIFSYLTLSQLSYLSFLLFNLNLSVLSYLLSTGTYISIYYPSTIYLTTYHLPPYCMPPPHVPACCSTIPLTSLWSNHPTKQSEPSAKRANSKPNMTQMKDVRIRWTSFQNTFMFRSADLNFPGKKPPLLKLEMKFFRPHFRATRKLVGGKNTDSRHLKTWLMVPWFWGNFGEILRCNKEEWLRRKGVMVHWDLID